VKELREKGVSDAAIQKISPLFSFAGSNKDKLKKMSEFLAQSEIGMKGIEELQFVLDQVYSLGLQKAELEFDITLARGLNYYTGAIFEVKAHGVKMGSICGGGRYDDLTGLFGMKGMSGVGISFGADRIYDVLTELELFPKETDLGLTLLFVNFGEQEQAYCMHLVKKVRDAGIDCELYPTAAKMQKQMKYANDRGVQFVALVGDNEMNSNTIQLKNLDTGDQISVALEELIERLK
jgi:histidyl-tRNA synthetase